MQALTPGDGAYCFLLNAQGRIQGDCTVWAEADRLLLQTSAAQVASLVALLDRFIIMDDVELRDMSGETYGVILAGPDAETHLRRIGIEPHAVAGLKRQTGSLDGQSYSLLRSYSPLVPRFEIWADPPAITEALLASGVTPCSPASFELLRILEVTPRFGADIRDRDLPQETNQTRALHFNKGCYLGQEIVERIRSRGNVHRTFSGFVLHGNIPDPGTPLEAEGKAVGELTSIASEEIDGKRLALGYVRREALERGLPLTYTGGHAEPRTIFTAS